MPNSLVFRETEEALREDIAKAEGEALSSFLQKVPADSVPTEENIRYASANALHVLMKRLFSPSTSKKLGINDAKIREVASYVYEIVRTDSIPVPPISLEFSPIRLGIAAAAGAFIGMLVFEPMGRYLLGLPGMGLAIGPLLGSFALVSFCVGPLRKGAVKWVMWVIPTALGFRELQSFLQGKMSGKRLSRIVKAGLIAFALTYLSKGEKKIYWDKYTKYIKQIINSWSTTAMAVLALTRECEAERGKGDNRKMRHLFAKIVELHSTNRENLPMVASELIQEAKNSGLGGLQGEPLFIAKQTEAQDSTLTWTEEMARMYDTYGHITPGDQVTIVERPVILDGKIEKKGLVRKERRK